MSTSEAYDLLVTVGLPLLIFVGPIVVLIVTGRAENLVMMFP